MKNLMWLLRWTLKAAVFVVLFAFALNNQQPGSVQFFFDATWKAPQVLILLAAFACGLVLGILAMVPRWWRWRRQAQRADKTNTTRTPELHGL